jgi:hypothetical protein
LARLQHLLDAANDAEERRAVLQEITERRTDLRAARAERAVNSAMASYTPDGPVGRRMATLRYDVPISQPKWLVDELVRLDASGALAAEPLQAIADRVVQQARSIDSQLPGSGAVAPLVRELEVAHLA